MKDVGLDVWAGFFSPFLSFFCWIYWVYFILCISVIGSGNWTWDLVTEMNVLNQLNYKPVAFEISNFGLSFHVNGSCCLDFWLLFPLPSLQWMPAVVYGLDSGCLKSYGNFWYSECSCLKPGLYRYGLEVKIWIWSRKLRNWGSSGEKNWESLVLLGAQLMGRRQEVTIPLEATNHLYSRYHIELA